MRLADKAITFESRVEVWEPNRLPFRRLCGTALAGLIPGRNNPLGDPTCAVEQWHVAGGVRDAWSSHMKWGSAHFEESRAQREAVAVACALGRHFEPPE